MGLDEMTGSPNLTVVPDPATFRVLPWAPGVGWVLCDEYFNSGVPFHFSSRQMLRKQLRRLAAENFACMVGLEVEWYLLRVADEPLSAENVGMPGMRGRPLKTYPAEPGYSYHSESNMDLMQPVLSALAEAYDKIGLPLRSIENEWGPGQVECTFAPRPALEAADAMLLFRSATRQICRRMGYFATFMARPAIKGYYASGWHLHQSLVDAQGGRNLFMPEQRGRSTVAARPRFSRRPAALCGAEHAVCDADGERLSPVPGKFACAGPRDLGLRQSRRHVPRAGRPGDPATRIENRVGEPAANPYLFIMSQIVAGLDGIAKKLEPGPSRRRALRRQTAHAAEEPARRRSMRWTREPLFRRNSATYSSTISSSSSATNWAAYQQFLQQASLPADGDEPTEWEQNEYFDFF